MAKKKTETTVPYTINLPDGRMVFITLPESMTRIDRDGSVLLKPAAVRRLDQARALAMKTPAVPTPAFIRTLRQALGMTQPVFAKRIGYSLPSVKRWETGTLKPGKAAAAKMQRLVKRTTDKGVVLAA